MWEAGRGLLVSPEPLSLVANSAEEERVHPLGSPISPGQLQAAL